MKLDRTVYINPLEPEHLGFRFSSGIDTKVDFHFKDLSGAPIAEDLVAQLQMTGRSTDITEYYSCPATDIVNGVARVLIPAGLSYDPNGYRLRLTGTVNREPCVIAYGTAVAMAGAGPQIQPQDVIDSIDINLTYGAPCTMTVTLWADEGKQTPYDLSGAIVSAAIYEGPGGALLLPFTVSAIAGSAVTLTLTSDEVDSLPTSGWWTLIVSSSAGTTTLAQGNVTVSA